LRRKIATFAGEYLENPICKDCGTEFKDNNNNSVCPKCGGKSKMVQLTANFDIPFHIQWKMRGKKLSKQIFELIFGDEKSTRLNIFVKKSRLIDKENDWYEETVINPQTGEIIHECKEKLSEHQQHGSAKKK
jgi:hypothetical protein